MDCDTAAYKQSRYDEIANEMKSMLVKVGWKKDFVEKNTPVLPISGWMGDNLLKKVTVCLSSGKQPRLLTPAPRGKFVDDLTNQ
jgi:translation elongation factor EF-1alpha